MSKIEERILDRKKKRKRKKKIKIVSISVLLFLVLLIGGGYYYVNHLYNSNSYEHFVDEDVTQKSVSSDTDTTEEQEPEPEYTKVEGITNILLLGLDARHIEDKSRSDSIMILTIDTIHNDIKLTSVMRDSYVRLYQKDEQKINSSYAYGGIALTMDTIESNFDINLDKYAIINFDGFQELVNIVGGLDINVEEYMIDEMNLCIKELGNEDTKYITEPGLQHLDGDQVLGYSRMRNIKGGDYGRTERQREVISKLMEKVQDVPKIKYFSIATQLLPYLKTNIELTEAFNLAYTVLTINNYDVQQLQIPVNELSTGLIHPNKGWLLIMDIDQNAQILNDFIFEDVPYDSNNVSYSEYKSYISRYYAEVNALEDAAKKEKEDAEKAAAEKEAALEEKPDNNEAISNEETTSITNNESTSNEETTSKEEITTKEPKTEETTETIAPENNTSEDTSNESTNNSNEDGQDTTSNDSNSTNEEPNSQESEVIIE